MAYESLLKSKCHLSSSPVIQNAIDCVQVKAGFCILGCVIIGKPQQLSRVLRKLKGKLIDFIFHQSCNITSPDCTL